MALHLHQLIVDNMEQFNDDDFVPHSDNED